MTHVKGNFKTNTPGLPASYFASYFRKYKSYFFQNSEREIHTPNFKIRDIFQNYPKFGVYNIKHDLVRHQRGKNFENVSGEAKL